MFTDPLTLDFDDTVASGDSEQIFTRTAWLPGGNGAVWMNTATDVADIPHIMKIAHSTAGSGVNLRDRRLIRFELSSINDESVVGLSLPAVAYVVYDIPRFNVAAAPLNRLTRMLCGFLRNADADDSGPTYAGNLTDIKNGAF